MNRLTFATPLALTLMASTGAFAQQAAPVAGFATPQAQSSYAVGLNVGSSLREDGLTLDAESFLRGVKDAMANAKPALTDEQVDETLRQLQIEVSTRRMEKIAAAAETNLAQGEAFLKANAAKPGVVTLPSGLQYQVVTAGTGPKPKASDTVECHYRGTLIDGTVFDSSAQHGGPASFPVGGVIPGWTEALQLMPVGSKWRLFIPAKLAYGTRGAGEDIGPNSTLIFDIELLGIEP